MTHEEAVIFLRQAAPTVKLRLYRDNAQTPVGAMSPTHNENKTICNSIKQKVCLRYVLATSFYFEYKILLGYDIFSIKFQTRSN